MKTLIMCPQCGGQAITKNGRLADSRQNFKCADCGRQFIENPRRRRIDPEIKGIIQKLLLEDVPPAKIARAIPGVSRRWVYEMLRRRRKSDGQ